LLHGTLRLSVGIPGALAQGMGHELDATAMTANLDREKNWRW